MNRLTLSAATMLAMGMLAAVPSGAFAAAFTNGSFELGTDPGLANQ